MFTLLDFIGHVPYFPMIFPSKSSLMTPKVTPEDMIFSYFQQVWITTGEVQQWGKSCSAKVGLKFHLCYDASLKVPCSMGSGGPLGVSPNWSADVDDFWCGDGSKPVSYQPFGGMNIRLPAVFDVNDPHFDGHRTTVLPWWGFNLLASYLPHQFWKTVMVLGRVKLQRANTPHCLWNFTFGAVSRTHWHLYHSISLRTDVGIGMQ